MLVASGAAADILEWRDEHGVRHFTNLREEIPAERRATAQVVVNELARRPAAVERASEPPAPVPQPEPRREAQVVSDRGSVSDAYIEGLVRGLEVGQGRGAAASPTMGGSARGASVQINGPLAIATATAPEYPYLPPYFPPLVTTSFDRGRSRHLTLRMLLQDQFVYDRDGPFVVTEGPGGLAWYGGARIDRNPYLPRGVLRRGACGRRVISR